MSYDTFLVQKGMMSASTGHIPEQLSDVLFDWQAMLVRWSLERGRAALFCDTGLGKTLMQLEWASHIPGNVIIVAPLAVAKQTVREAAKLSGVDIQYRREPSSDLPHITITNYEHVHKFDAGVFGGVVLDESSILKSVEGKTRGKLIGQFHDTPYRLACTATPAPNDIAEFANHAEFLGICTRQEMLSMFFVHDDEGWRIKGHAKQAFYKWMASWAMMVRKPSDLGFANSGFDLPALNTSVEWVDAHADELAQEQGYLFPMGLRGIQGRSAARRSTIANKVDRVAAIINASSDQWVVWHWMNEEGYQLQAAIPGAVLVEGKQSPDEKESALLRFIDGDIRILITKPSIAGFGLNMQNCHNVAFMGLTDSWETYYQAVRRCWRFGQTHPVNVVIVMTDIERPIMENISRKEQQHEEVASAMIENVNDYQRAELGLLNISHNGYHPKQVAGEGYTMFHGDCVEGLAMLAPDSIDFSVFSPPFMSLYTYTDSERDLGNSRDEVEFFGHFQYVIAGLLRVLKTGRLIACHVAQVPAKLIVDNYIGLKDFRGKTIQAFIDGGFIFYGEVAVDKNPQAQAIRTHAKGLLFKQLHKDATWIRPGLADFVLLFRKPGESAVPVLPDISNDQWIEWAHPIWYDIRESDTLHVAEARAEKDERHVAPLQLGLIERCIRLWSNPGETVLSPFAGIGSEGYQAILGDRRFVGMELKESYFNAAVRNLNAAITKKTQGRLL
jgi:DNA modification methylase/superfamily II DNA or RNA helicase